jgi:hypothetical protein
MEIVLSSSHAVLLLLFLIANFPTVGSVPLTGHSARSAMTRVFLLPITLAIS